MFYVVPLQGNPNDGPGPNGYTPAQVRTAYGINNISFTGSFTGQGGDGTGQTIAILDAYNDPVIAGEVDAFDQALSRPVPGTTLYQQYGNAAQFLTVYNQSGTVINPASTNVPVDPSGSWEGEEALDVEWAHAIAPGAKIDLVETNDSSASPFSGKGCKPRPVAGRVGRFDELGAPEFRRKRL